MSNTPKRADDVKKILDQGKKVLLYKNELGSYTSIAFDEMPNIEDGDITDDFELNDDCEQLRELVEFAFHEPTHMNSDGYPMLVSEEDEAWRCSESRKRLHKIFGL